MLLSCSSAIGQTSIKEAAALVEKGKAAANKKDNEAALIFFTKAIKLNPKNSAAYEHRSVLYDKLKKFPETLADCNKIIELNNDSKAYENRANLYHKTKKFEEAIADAGKAIELDPATVWPFFIRGDCYIHEFEYQKAVWSLINIYLERDKEYLRAYNRRGYAYTALGKYKEAIDDCTKGLASPEYRADSFYNRANAHHMLGKFSEAIFDATAAIAIDPNKPYYYRTRSLAYLALGEEKKALPDTIMFKYLTSK